MRENESAAEKERGRRERETSGPVGDKAIKSSVRARERGYQRRNERQKEKDREKDRNRMVEREGDGASVGGSERECQDREGRVKGVGWHRGVSEEPGKGKGMLRVLAWTSASTAVASHEPPKL